MLTTACTVPCSEPALALAGSGNAAAPFQAAPGFAQALQRQTEQARDTSREAERRAGRDEGEGRETNEPAPAPRRGAAAAAPPAEAQTPRGATPHDERPTRPAAAATARALPERTRAADAGTLVAAAAAAGEASCMDVEGAAHRSDDGSAPADTAPALPGTVAPDAPTLPPEALLAWVAGLALPASPAPAPAGSGAAARPGRTQTDGAATTAAGASDATTPDPIPAHATPLGRAAAPDGAAAVDASSSGSASSAPASARRDERATGQKVVAAAADAPASPAAGAAPALPAPGDAIAALLHEPALQRPGALAEAATAATTATSAASAALAALPAGAAAAPPLSSDAAAAPLQGELREPLGSAQFAPALASRLTVLVRGGIEHAQLRLNPAEMGPIEVRIRIDGAHTQVDFSAAQAQTRQVLQEAVPVLAGALREAGLTLTGGGVFEQPRQPRGEHAAHDGRAAQPQRQGRALDDTLSAAAATARPARARGVVDLYA